MPVSDVAAVGGWKDIATLLTCYTQADADTMLAVKWNHPGRSTKGPFPGDILAKRPTTLAAKYRATKSPTA